MHRLVLHTRLFSPLPAEQFCSYTHFIPEPCSFPKSWNFQYTLPFISKWHHGPAQAPLEFTPSTISASCLAGSWEMHILGPSLLGFLGGPSSHPYRKFPTPPLSTAVAHGCSLSLAIVYPAPEQFLCLWRCRGSSLSL